MLFARRVLLVVDGIRGVIWHFRQHSKRIGKPTKSICTAELTLHTVKTTVNKSKQSPELCALFSCFGEFPVSHTVDWNNRGAKVTLDDSMGGEPTIININARKQTITVIGHQVPKVSKFRKPIPSLSKTPLEFDVQRREQYTFDNIHEASFFIAEIVAQVFESKNWEQITKNAKLLKEGAEHRKKDKKRIEREFQNLADEFADMFN